jgi:GntR family transcriptional regulator
MTINRGDPRTPAEQIADDLRDAINAGELAADSQLPSERELADRYSVSTKTAASAMQRLKDEGLVVSRAGAGRFVRRAVPLIRLGSDRYSHKYRESGLSPFLLECAKQGKTGRFDVLGIDHMVPPEDVAQRLALSTEESSVLRRENVFYADADPVHRVTTWIPWTIADGTGLLEEDIPHQYGIHGVLEDQGHVMTRFVEEVSARMPNPDERKHLQLESGVSVLDVLHTSLDQNGQPYELTRFVMRADMTGLRYDSPVE